MVREFEGEQYWAVILGGSSGLGLASALKLAAHGMNICIIHRNSRAELPNIEVAFKAISALNVQVLSYNIDVLNGEKREACLAELHEAMGTSGKVRCLLHSIAKGSLKPMENTNGPVLEPADFMITLQNMAVSLYEWTSAVFNVNLFARDARVISFTSEGGRKAWKHYAAVSAAKASLEAITRSIALEFAAHGIRANCIQAGVTDTLAFGRIPGAAALLSATAKRNPFKRSTTPEDVANVVYLLCKDEAAWINGAIIPVDGGEQIN